MWARLILLTLYCEATLRILALALAIFYCLWLTTPSPEAWQQNLNLLARIKQLILSNHSLVGEWPNA